MNAAGICRREHTDDYLEIAKRYYEPGTIEFINKVKTLKINCAKETLRDSMPGYDVRAFGTIHSNNTRTDVGQLRWTNIDARRVTCGRPPRTSATTGRDGSFGKRIHLVQDRYR